MPAYRFRLPVPPYAHQIMEEEASTGRCLITTCPNEVLYMIVRELRSLKDLLRLSQTCQLLRAVCWDSQIALPVISRDADHEVVVSPHPHTILAGIGRQITDWAIGDATEENHRDCRRARTRQLDRIMSQGSIKLLNWAGRFATMNLSQLRALTVTKYDIVKPLGESFSTNRYIPWDTKRSFYYHWMYSEIFYINLENAASTLAVRKTELPKALIRAFKNCLHHSDGDFPEIGRTTGCAERTMKHIRNRISSDLLQRLLSPVLNSAMAEGGNASPKRLELACSILQKLGPPTFDIMRNPSHIDNNPVVISLGRGIGSMKPHEISRLSANLQNGKLDFY